MSILFRYVLREFLVPLSYCFTGFIAIYVLFELFGSFGRIAASGASFGKIVIYFAGYLAPYFEWMAPACLMLAALYTMWSFCRHSEIVAMRASGVGFQAIVRPMLVAAAVVTLAVAWTNECFMPKYAQWAADFRAAHFDEAQMDRTDDAVFHNTPAGRTWRVGAVVADDATVLEDVRVSIDRPGAGRAMNIVSPRAEFLDGQWWFHSPKVQYFGPGGSEIPDPAPELAKLTIRVFPGIDDSPRDFLLQNRDWQYCSVSDRRRWLKLHESLAPEARASGAYDVWAQAVAPLACLVITLFAIPAGVATGRQSVFRGIVTALLMFFSFYAFTIAFMVLAKKGLCPAPVAALAPDAVFTCVGLWLFHRQR